MKKVAVVDDEEDIVKIISFYLRQEGFAVEEFLDGESFLKAVSKYAFDCVVLDLMLPGVSGIDVLKILRSDRKTSELPIIVLTAKGSESDIVSGFELGANDYVVKPFKGRVLAARVKALLRSRAGSLKFQQGDLLLDSEKFTVFCKDKKVTLTSTEFKILQLLLSKPGKVFSRNDILDYVWKSAEEPYDRAVDVHIRHIRSKLGSCGNKIKTVRGMGYKFSDE